MNKIIAGIVLYNPKINILEKNINAVICQISEVVIVDNFSDNINEVEILLKNYDKIKLIKNSKNKGIAYALNQVFKYADKNEIKWVLTLDQDSVIPDKLIDRYAAFKGKEKIAQISCNIFESSAGKMVYSDKNKCEKVKRCITSGTLTSVIAWKAVGGYDDYLFIDYVDYDFSVKLTRKGYMIIRCNDVCIKHHLGNSEMHRFLFIPVRVTNYSCFRKYYISRNIIVYMKRHCDTIDGMMEILRLMRIAAFTILYENEKKEKIKSIIRGIHDGIHIESSKKR